MNAPEEASAPPPSPPEEKEIVPAAADTSKTDADEVPETVKEVSGRNLVENDSTDDAHGGGKQKSFPVREVKFRFPIGGNDSTTANAQDQIVSFNPVTSLFGILVLWGLSFWCMFDPQNALLSLQTAKSQVSYYFTWLYIVSRPIFVFFVLFIGWRYKGVKLGMPNTPPEFTGIEYFTMLFSAGIGTGLFFYGVAEPLWFQSDNWFANINAHTQDEIDQNAINQTLFHWGFAAWGSYIVVAIAQSLGTYRFGLPMTFRSSFYPMLGDYTWGFWGDVIDSLTLVTTVAGICTSLGLGAFQIIAGIQRLGWISDDLSAAQETAAQCISVCIITIIATASVMSGLNLGIKFLSMLGFGLGMLLLFLCLALDKTNYVLNLGVQSFGYYFQWTFFQLNFWTDAFGQLNDGEGRASDGQAAPVWFMDAWTIFYMAWWCSWSGFVGIFIARVSRGRTIGEVVVYSFGAPFIYTILWFATFGGIGLRQARQALELSILGETYFNDTGYFLNPDSTYCYDVPQQDVVVGDQVIFTNTLPGITPVCEFNSAESNQAWYNVMYSFSFPQDGFEGFGAFMAGLSVVSVTVYFITSSDSGSLVVDHLASNGAEHHHWSQRLFWALTEGLVACALLLAGGADALSALQAISIVFGLPFTVMILYFCQSVLSFCEQAEKHDAEYAASIAAGETPSQKLPDYVLTKGFTMPIFGGIFNVMEYAFSLGNVHEARINDLPTSFQIQEFFVALFVPFTSLARIMDLLYPKASSKITNKLMVFSYMLMHLLWIALFASAGKSRLFVAVGFAAFFINGCLLMGVRGSVRGRMNLGGNVMEDFLSSSFFYPQVLVQILNEYELRRLNNDTTNATNKMEELDC